MATTKNPMTKAELQARLNQVQHQTDLLLQMNNTLVRRAEIAAGLGKQFGGDRDLYEAFGYPKNPQYEHYLNIYERDGLGTRIVDAVSDETWRERPVLVEGENVKIDELDDPGPLQKAFAELDDEFHLLSAFNEVDAACGISRFGLIFLGLPGKLEDEVKGKAKLMYVNVYDEGNAQIDDTSIIRDPSSPRFGLPERYQIAVDDKTKSFKNVHWSRVIHVKEGTDKRDYRRVYGNPRLKNMLNRLWDLEKVVGSGSEAFWLLIRKGLAITAKEGMTLPSHGTPEYNDLVDEIEEYEHGLSRIMKLMGLDVKDLGSEPVSSRDQFDVITDYLAGTSRIPKRIMLGSERGELASSQDEFNFGAFIQSRQSKFAEPFILRPTIDRLGELGILKVPPKYTAVWKSLFQLTDMDKSTIANNVASAMSTVSGGAPETVMPLDVYAQRYLDYKPSPQDQAEIEESKTKADEANRQPPPSPTDAPDPFKDLLEPSGNGNGRSQTDKARLNQIIDRLTTPNKYIGYIHLNDGTLDSWHSEPFVMIVNQNGENDNSAMIAFKIPDVLKAELKDKYPWMPQDIVNELHVTLCYLGDIRTLPREKIEQAVGAFAMAAQPLKVELQGIGRFVSGMDKDPVVATFDSPGDELGELRQWLVSLLEESGIPYWDNHGFIPHMTMAYIAPDEEMPAQTVEKLEINFDSVYLVIGGEWSEYKFGEMPESARPYIGEDGLASVPQLNKILENMEAITNYDPDQPRDPKGTSTGGQWTSEGTGIDQDVYAGEQLLKVTEKRDQLAERMATIRGEMETTPTRFADVSDNEILDRRERFYHQMDIAKKDGREEDHRKWKSKWEEAGKEIARRRELSQLERQHTQTLESLETGKLTVTESEMTQLLGSAGDTYRDAGYRGEYNPDLFITSDLSGARIRHYIRLPDGRVAHPDELIEARRRGRIIVIKDVRKLETR